MFHVSIGWLEIYPSWLISCLLNSQVGFSAFQPPALQPMQREQHMKSQQTKTSGSQLWPATDPAQPTKWKQMLENENSKVPKSQAFELFEFLIYSIPVFHTIFDKEKDLSRVHSSCCVGDRFGTIFFDLHELSRTLAPLISRHFSYIDKRRGGLLC